MAQGGQMVGLLGPVHAFGGEDADCDLLPEEVSDEGAGDAAVEALLLGGIEVLLLGTGAHQLAEGVLIDVVVHLAADHGLVEVEALDVPALGSATFGKNSLDHAKRLPLFLDEGEDESDDVGDDVSILKLL